MTLLKIQWAIAENLMSHKHCQSTADIVYTTVEVAGKVCELSVFCVRFVPALLSTSVNPYSLDCESYYKIYRSATKL